MTHARRTFVALVCLALVLLGRPAFADVTAFIGASPTPASRQARGVAIGMSLVVVGFEFEYSSLVEDTTQAAPGLQTGMGNVLLQTPSPILGFRPYATAGAGLYHETLGAVSNTGFGTNVGAGVKVSLVGPLRLRVDYRLFNLAGNALQPHPQRIYAGLNLSF
ncbi:MAG: outer membrane beta-barrel protein [Acidobacteriota bacterium]|nr:outer membrane beta-barrel protein [Acidobacteriota bacterium]